MLSLSGLNFRWKLMFAQFVQNINRRISNDRHDPSPLRSGVSLSQVTLTGTVPKLPLSAFISVELNFTLLDFRHTEEKYNIL